MGTPQWNIQTAVVAKFTNDATLAELAPVYDAVPDFAAYPYIEIGEFTENARNVFRGSGKDVTMLLHIFSDYEGNKELYAVRNEIDRLLDRKSGGGRLDLGSGHSLIGCSMEFSDIINESDTVRHMVVRYRILTTEN